MTPTPTPESITQTIITELLQHRTPFTTREVSDALPKVATGTISGVVSRLLQAKALTATMENGARHVKYSLGPGFSTEVAYKALRAQHRRYKHRQGGRPRRRFYTRTPEPTPGGGLAQLRDALDKATLYDRLLAYLKLTDREVREVLGKEA